MCWEKYPSGGGYKLILIKINEYHNKNVTSKKDSCEISKEILWAKRWWRRGKNSVDQCSKNVIGKLLIREGSISKKWGEAR